MIIFPMKYFIYFYYIGMNTCLDMATSWNQTRKQLLSNILATSFENKFIVCLLCFNDGYLKREREGGGVCKASYCRPPVVLQN